MTQYAVMMLVAGIGIPILAALNAALGLRLESPVAAAVILFCVALSATILTWGVSRALGGAAALPILRARQNTCFWQAHWWHFTFYRSPLSRQDLAWATRCSLC